MAYERKFFQPLAFQGRITSIGSIQTSQKGNKYISFIINLVGGGEQELLLFKEKAESFPKIYKVNDTVEVNLNMDSRQYVDKNGQTRYITTLSLQSITQPLRQATIDEQPSEDFGDIPF